MPQGTRKQKATSLPAVLLSEQERQQLKEAYCKLEHPSLAARLSNVVGTPIEIAFQLMPREWADRLHETTHRSITRALDVAVNTLHDEHNGTAKDHYHKVLSTATGAAGGFFGLPALFVELPVTTTLMLRSIADIARTYGEDLEDPEVRLSCIGVFALGARTDELTALQEAAALEAANPLAPGWALRPLRLDPLSLSPYEGLQPELFMDTVARLWLNDLGDTHGPTGW